MKKLWLVGFAAIVLLALVASCSCGESGTTVRAILFYSPSCPHCHQVMTEVLPPLQQRYGSRLQIAQIDTTTPEGQQLYQSAVTYFNIGQERRGVPTLVVDSVVLVGSGEIPQYFPNMIEQGLAQGGVDWPAIPGFVPPAE